MIGPLDVKIEEIQGAGLAVERPIPDGVRSDLFSPAEAVQWLHSTPLRAQFSRVSGEIHVRGEFDAGLAAQCSRCLGPVQATLPVSFHLRMVKQNASDKRLSKEGEDDEAGERAGSFDLDDVDVEPFDGRTIDLASIVREQLLLSVPAKWVCTDECKGLCTVCGQNLNDAECGCERKGVDIRLAKLKEVKLH